MKKVLTIGSGMQDVFTEYEGVETLHLHTKEEDLCICLHARGKKNRINTILYIIAVVVQPMVLCHLHVLGSM